jgi:hypothetical protein
MFYIIYDMMTLNNLLMVTFQIKWNHKSNFDRSGFKVLLLITVPKSYVGMIPFL